MGLLVWLSGFVIVGLGLLLLTEELESFHHAILKKVQINILSKWDQARIDAFNICWEPLVGLFILALFYLLFLNLNSAWILMVAALLWIFYRWRPLTFKHAFFLVLGCGLIIWASESVLRLSGIVLQQAEDFPVLYIFAEKGIKALALSLMVGAAISFLFAVPSLATIIGLILVLMGSASLLFAFGLWVGERLVHHLFFLRKGTDYVWRSLGVFVLLTVLVLFFPFFQQILESLSPGVYQTDLRYSQAVGLLAFSSLAEIATTSVVLHLRHKVRLKS